jgi:hypothetical protein
MKWLRTLIIFDKGNIVSSADWSAIHKSYVRSIESIDFPLGTGKLKLREKEKRADGQWNRNGVGYLRKRFLDHITNEEKWKAESAFTLGESRKPPTIMLYPGNKVHHEEITSEFGDFDLVSTAKNGSRVAIEWETGNISSSHRSVNKLAIAISTRQIDAGVLIVPSRGLYNHLTDRIGNIGELAGYLSMWHGIGAAIERGLLAITVVEHDELTTSKSFNYLPTGNDGRAKEGSAKRTK